MNTISKQTLDNANSLLDEFIDDVNGLEGTLAGGEKLGIGGQALMALKETKVTFGHPIDNLTKLTSKLFDDIEVKLDPIQREQLDKSFDFYYMTLTVSMHPKRGVLFQRVECKLDFGPKTKNVPIIQTLFPAPKWLSVLEGGVGMSLGLNGNLEWEASIQGDELGSLRQDTVSFKTAIKTSNKIGAHIVVPEYSYQLGHAEISATGEGNTYCMWRLQNPELKQAQTIRFAVVFKVPKGTESIELEGIVAAEPKFSWLASQLDNVFTELADKFKSIFKLSDDERTGKERLPIGSHEKWVLPLPR